MPKTIKTKEEIKITRPDSADDQFKDAIAGVRERIRVRQRTLVTALAVFLVILIGVGSFVLYMKYQKEQAATFMQDGFKAYYGTAGQQPLPAPERYTKALESFRKAFDAHKAATPLLYQGYALYDLGKYDDAITALKQLTDNFSDPRVLPLALYKLSQAYLQKNDPTAALAALNDMAKGNGGMQDLALMESARLQAMLGKADEAKVKYQELVTRFPNSSFAAEAKTKLGTK